MCVKECVFECVPVYQVPLMVLVSGKARIWQTQVLISTKYIFLDRAIAAVTAAKGISSCGLYVAATPACIELAEPQPRRRRECVPTVYMYS